MGFHLPSPAPRDKDCVTQVHLGILLYPQLGGLNQKPPGSGFKSALNSWQWALGLGSQPQVTPWEVEDSPLDPLQDTLVSLPIFSPLPTGALSKALAARNLEQPCSRLQQTQIPCPRWHG